MSTSRHPVAYRLEQLVEGPTRLLATVMGLPLVDGIFPALVLAGALSEPLRVIETGLLIFGGSATMAVILAEMDGTPREHVAAILTLAAILLPVAALEAALAETIKSLLNLVVFERFAALVILAVAAKTASAEIGELLPRPGAIIGLGLLASLSPSGAKLAINADPGTMASAAAAAGVGVVFALGVAVAGPQLRGRVDIDRFRFGSAVALGVLGLSVLDLGLIGSDNPVALGVLLVTAIFSYDPDGESDPRADDDPDSPAGVDSDSARGGDAADGDSPADESGERPPADSPGDGWDGDRDTPSVPGAVADAVDPDAADTRAVADGAARAVSARESWGTVASADGGSSATTGGTTGVGAFGSGDAGVDETASADGGGAVGADDAGDEERENDAMADGESDAAADGGNNTMADGEGDTAADDKDGSDDGAVADAGSGDNEADTESSTRAPWL